MLTTFWGTINMTDLNPDNIKVDKKLQKNSVMYYIGYVRPKSAKSVIYQQQEKWVHQRN